MQKGNGKAESLHPILAATKAGIQRVPTQTANSGFAGQWDNGIQYNLVSRTFFY